MSKQVPERRARWPGRLVEVDDPLLGRDQRCERRHELRYRRPFKDAPFVAPTRTASASLDHGDGCMLDGPLVDQPKRIHAARY
jgi:hypothetical protein